MVEVMCIYLTYTGNLVQFSSQYAVTILQYKSHHIDKSLFEEDNSTLYFYLEVVSAIVES